MSFKRFRYILFLKDVFVLAVSAFGGPQAHIAMMFELLVKKRAYLSEDDLIELNALCQLLPGPTSTQTIIAIGLKKGGVPLALMTFLVWVFPAGTLMILIALYTRNLEERGVDLSFTRFIQPLAISFIFFAGYKIAVKVIKKDITLVLMLFSLISAYVLTQWLQGSTLTTVLYPLLLIVSGVITSFNYDKHKKVFRKERIKIKWDYLICFILVFALAAIIGNVYSNRVVLLFENFYRNGSLIFGGGQVLIPLLKVQFVDYKNYLSSSEFLSGIGFVNAMPGPVFSVAGYIGTMSMKGSLTSMQVLGGVVSILGVFLPGIFLIFFVHRFWEQLKNYRPIRASLSGISAAGTGLVFAASFLLMDSVALMPVTEKGIINLSVLVGTFLLLLWGKIPSPVLILSALLLGAII